MSHTPGPWIHRTDGDEWTCDIVTQEGVNTEGTPMFWNIASYNKQRHEAEDNAKLIAAAPDLLIALQGLVAYFNWAITPEVDNARAAIAKALGQ